VFLSKKRVDSALSSIQEKIFPPEHPAETPVGMSEVERSYTAGGQTADDEPHGKLPPRGAGESCTLRRIVILKSRLNQHSESTGRIYVRCFLKFFPLEVVIIS
jgi:hypothetical protein